MNPQNIIKFLKNNDVSFSVPGMYDLPTYVVVEAVEEFIKNGSSNLIKKHKEWTWGCWEINDCRKHCIVRDRKWCSIHGSSSKRIKKLIGLKEFWGDEDDLSFLHEALESIKEEEKIRRTYTYKRKKEFTEELKQKCKARDGFMCVLCQQDYDLEIDHKKPLIKGGTNALENLQTLCNPCHKEKTKKDLK